MADDHTQRPFRATEPSARPASERAAAGSDPLAELARLIGQNDPFGEFGRPPAVDPRAPSQPEQGAHGYYDTPTVPGAPPMAVSDQAGHAQQGYDPAAHPEMHPDPDPHMAPYGAEELDFYDDVPPRRRMGVVAIAAVFVLAVLGTAGAVGYRALFGSSSSGPPPVIKANTTPSKVAPASKKDGQSAKLIQDRVTEKGAGEKLVSREERPIDMNKPAGVFPQAQGAASSGSVQPPALGSGVIATDPKKVRTIAIRPDGVAVPGASAAMPTPAPAAGAPTARVTNITPAERPPEPPATSAQPAATEEPPPPRQTSARAAPAPRNAPLSLNPNAELSPAAAPAPAPAAPPPRAATAAPTQLAPQAGSQGASAAGGYAVQVSSRRSEADAQASFRSLQSRYPDQLGGRQPLIRRVDLGEKGIYYRTMVGPFDSSEEAKQLCEQLKAVGGSCFIQRI